VPQHTRHSPARYGSGPAAPPDDGGLRESPARRPVGPARTEPGAPRAGAAGAGAARAGAAVRLTGRGAIIGLFGLSFVGLLVSDWLSVGVLGDATFVAACVVIACYTKPSDLLPVTVCPPLVFLIACLCAKIATSAGGMAAAEGTLVALGNSAPWLFAGTVLTVVIGLRRGLLGNVRELRRGLHGDPDLSGRDGGSGGRRPPRSGTS
jgi:hypothetical protein